MERIKCPQCRGGVATMVITQSGGFCMACGYAVQKKEAEKEENPIREELFAVCAAAEQFFAEALWKEEAKEAREYLKKRGLTEEALKRRRIGYCPPGKSVLKDYLEEKGFKEEAIEKCGLFKRMDDGSLWCIFRGRIMFPIRDENARVVSFGGRVTDSTEPKYRNGSESAIFSKREHLYGMDSAGISGGKTFILCEGYMDTIALQEAGFRTAVASLGTALTAIQAKLIGKHAENCILLYDTDLPGRKACEKALKLLEARRVPCRIADSLPYKDPDELIREKGAERMLEKLKEAKTPGEYRAETALHEDGGADYERLVDILIKERGTELLRKLENT